MKNCQKHVLENIKKVLNLRNFYFVILILIIYFLSITVFKYFITEKEEEIIKFLPPIGIILSALLASLSVLRTIDNTNKIEKEKKEKEEKQFKNKLKIYMNETIFFVETYLQFHKGKIFEMDNNTRIKILSWVEKAASHSKNLMIKDVSFLEKIEKNEFSIIKNLNFFEMAIEHISNNFSVELLIMINKKMKKILDEISALNEIYTLEVTVENYITELEELEKQILEFKKNEIKEVTQ